MKKTRQFLITILIEVLATVLPVQAAEAEKGAEAGVQMVEAGVQVQDAELSDEAYEEKIKRKITALAGYEEEGLCGERAEELHWRIITKEFEPGSGRASFVAVYAVSTRGVGRLYHRVFYGDVWAVKDGVYTKLFENVELGTATSGGIDWIEMDGRTFLLVRTKVAVYGGYAPDPCYLYSFYGEEPVCVVDDFFELRINREKQILSLYMVSPLGTYDLGRLNAYNPYRDCVYFFTCKDGEFMEVTGEPCTEAEFRENIFHAERLIHNSWVKGSDDGTELERYYYRIPGIGYYYTLIYLDKDHDYEGEDQIGFSHEVCYDPAFHTQEFVFVGPHGYRYTSWLNRREEEKELCRKVKEVTGEDISVLLANQQGYEEATLPPDVHCMAVRKGESLYSIGERYWDLTWQELYAWNRDMIGENPGRIYPGMVLRLEAPE